MEDVAARHRNCGGRGRRDGDHSPFRRSIIVDQGRLFRSPTDRITVEHGGRFRGRNVVDGKPQRVVHVHIALVDDIVRRIRGSGGGALRTDSVSRRLDEPCLLDNGTGLEDRVGIPVRAQCDRRSHVPGVPVPREQPARHRSGDT